MVTALCRHILHYASLHGPTELDSSIPDLMTDYLFDDSQIMRIVPVSGRPVREVMEMLEEYKCLAKMESKMKGK
ncbi:hypothetical protein AAC387_Pa04g1691 [Persea americana]